MTTRTHIDRLLESRPTHVFRLLDDIKKAMPQLKTVDTWSQADGVATLMRDTDGQAYEITVRPAAAAQHPGINQAKGSGKGWARPGRVKPWGQLSPKVAPLP